MAQGIDILKEKVLVLGSTGLIGHQVFNYLKINDHFDLYNFSYRNKLQEDTIIVDARNIEHFCQKIIDVSPNFIINCIGVLINGANADPANAIFINSYMPHQLEKVADDIGAKLIHISTDCVFSGDKNSPYVESDEKDGRGIYAKTKGLGEIINDKHLTLRTSVVGPELKSDGEELFHWFMNETSGIQGYTDAIWSGVTTFELARAVKWALDNHITGLYHVTNNESISKFELLNLFRKYTKKNISIESIPGNKVDKSFIDTRMLLDYKIPSYDTMVADMIELISSNKNLYSQYKLGT
ncbi:SDR family oxidoreductase [Gammaproteobacteria bacterium]|nr:SDR family oxidoreductase [Gammaproteobacteria bacterium]